MSKWIDLDKKTTVNINVEDDVIDIAHHPHEHMGETYPLKSHLKELDLTNCRLKAIENTSELRNLHTFCMRQNLVTKIVNLDPCQALTYLDLYDNQITVIENLNLPNLTHLDLSFNRISKIENIPPSVEKLYLCQNQISDMNGLGECKSLRLLELGSNQISKIELNIDSLEELWLGKNKISKIEGLTVGLTRISLQDNLITKMEGLNHLTNLTELYLSENGIKKIEGLENLKNLVILDVSNNRISCVENVEHLDDMEEFWCTDNRIELFSNISVLAKCKSLKSVYFQRNKLDQDMQYKRKILIELPNVKEIDGIPVMKK